MPPLLTRSSSRGSHGSPLGPGGRPGQRWRAFFTFLSVAWISATTLVMLSDRAPGLLKRLAAQVDAGGSRAAKTVSEAPIPESDFEIHVLAWLVAALLVGMATWSWRSLALAGVSLFAFSMAVEGGQHLLTATRSAQLGDLTANAIGVALGIGVAAVIAAGLRLGVRR